MNDLLSIYQPANRTKLLVFAGLLVTTIAAIDLMTKPYISLGLLYLFPIMIVGGFLSRTQTVAIAVICATLQEAFSNLPATEAVVRLVLSSAGFIGTGLFVSELTRNRRIVLTHIEALESQIRLREDAEEQLRILVESSPAAIVTIDSNGEILLANEAAQQLLAPDAGALRGRAISSYLPSLQTVVQDYSRTVFRTALQCRGTRSNGEVFLAGIWFSTYITIGGPRLAAIIVDLSDDLRNREDLSLDRLLRNSKILMSAVAHEVRNLCGAVLVVHKNLSQLSELEHNEDFHALSTLIQSLEKMLTAELLMPASVQGAGAVDLVPVLDELRVLIATAFDESEIEIQWHIPESLPLVWADRYGLIQVFLNLSSNSQRAMESSEMKRLSVSACNEADTVEVRFEDTGVGISSPEHLFRPFQPGATSTGMGLYVSRAIIRSFGGELIYEPRPRGCSFVAILTSLSSASLEETPSVDAQRSDSLAR